MDKRHPEEPAVAAHTQRVSLRVSEIAEVTGVPEHTVRKALGNDLPCCHINQKIQVVLVEDLVSWLKTFRRVQALVAPAAESAKRATNLTAKQRAVALKAERDYRRLMED